MLGLNLKGLPTTNAETAESARNNILEILLGVLSGVLGALLAALAVIYFIKGRSYKRQIEVLAASTFGSESSDLNSNIKPLPNTNIFSNVLSNPVMTNSKMKKADLDTQSIISADSDDFAGLGENPIFNIDSDNWQTEKPHGQKFQNAGTNESSYI